MKVLSSCVFGFTFSVCTICVAQVDIYQSDAYSVEEMCAQEAEQSNAEDYSAAYEACIEKNRGNSMYQPELNETGDQEHSEEGTEESVTEDDAELQTEEAEAPEQAYAY